MKWFLLSLLALISSTASAAHFDLEMGSEEYGEFLASDFAQSEAVDPEIDATLKLGTRLLQWVAFENAHRPANHQLLLTNAQNRPGVPIETPNSYNPTLIQQRVDKAFAGAPGILSAVLNGSDLFPAKLPIADDLFLDIARQINSAYQFAARWKALSPYQNYYIQRKKLDVRGYYFLNKYQWDETRLSHLNQEGFGTQEQVKDWLKQECLNHSESDAVCTRKVATAFQTGTLGEFYRKYHPIGKQTWDSYFSIPSNAKRSDVNWKTGAPEQMTVPFLNPTEPSLLAFLKDNIEDEWRTASWALHLKWVSDPAAPRIEFQSGALPHADAIGGNVITMDENAPLSDYEVDWTIRHEFGHVLGFPDCYLEFYDAGSAAFVSYQLDTTDLMCSRKGNLKPRHYDELKRVYGASSIISRTARSISLP